MIQTTILHFPTLVTTDERTANLANYVHNMHEWHSQGLMTSEMFVHLHDILRANLGTKYFIAVLGFQDQREEKMSITLKL